MFYRWLIPGGVAAILAAPAARPSVTLVADGQPRATVVLPAEASETLRLAAEELVTHLEKMSGAKLPVVTEGDDSRLHSGDSQSPIANRQSPIGGGEEVAVLLGPTRRTTELKLPLTNRDVGFDGYVIQTRPDTLVLCGRKDAGTLNAVYGLLEDHLGVRWYYPGDLGTVIPYRATVEVGDVTEVQKPHFEVRSPWYNGNVTADLTAAEQQACAAWHRRNRNGGIHGYVGHYWDHVFAACRETHPEYFSLIQGRRGGPQLCTSNPQVLDLYVQDALSRFRADPDFQYASLSPNDGAGWCECADCQAVSPDLTTRILTFINAVARRVGQEFPDRYLAFYAYADLVNPPADLTPSPSPPSPPKLGGTEGGPGEGKCEPNVMPWIAHYSVCQVHPLGDPRCPPQTNFRRIVEGWKAMSEQIGVREYASWWPVPIVEARRLAEDTRYYAGAGGRGMSREYLEMQYGTHLLAWLESKLLWNPRRDLSELLDDFFPTFYGPAGPALRAVYDRLAAQMRTVPYCPNYTGNEFEAPRLFPQELLQQCVKEVAAAEEALPPLPPPLHGGEGGVYRQRVRRERLALEAAVQFLDRWAATQAYQQSGREEDRQAALAALQRTIALRDALPDNLIVSGMQRAEARRQVQLLTGNRCEITQAGEWGFADDLNAGGMVRRDAEELTGFYLGTWGLGLPNGAEGTLVYRFTAKNGRHFTEAHLHALYLTRKEGLQTRIEVQKDDGPWQVFSENEGYSGWERQYPLTDLLAGATAFRVRFRARNGTGDSVLVLDNVGFGGKVE